jgi:hypothetical protein
MAKTLQKSRFSAPPLTFRETTQNLTATQFLWRWFDFPHLEKDGE